METLETLYCIVREYVEMVGAVPVLLSISLAYMLVKGVDMLGKEDKSKC